MSSRAILAALPQIKVTAKVIGSYSLSWLWWHKPVNPAQRRQKLEDHHELEASLVYIARLCIIIIINLPTGREDEIYGPASS